MARTKEGARLTELHRQRQAALSASIMKEVMKLYPMWDLRDEESFRRFQDAMIPVAQRGATDSAALAAAYYESFRIADAPGDPDRIGPIIMAAAPTDAEIRDRVEGAAKGGVYRAFRAGRGYQQALDAGLVQVTGCVSRLALDKGRDTIITATFTDSKATAWARVTSGKPCAFCAMLASRGPVYSKQTVDFHSHERCRCTAEPLYEGAAWPGQSQKYYEVWKQTGNLNDFRTALRHGALD